MLFTFAAQLSAQRDLKIERIPIQKKRALVIGNAAYPRAPLKNPTNDAADIAEVLRKLGFDVIAANDLTLRLMDKALDEFGSTISSGDLAFFYFAGHGVQINQENYLIPIDFTVRSEADVKYDALSASRVRDKIEASGARLRVLILDACRNNPYHVKRDAEGGLAAMKSDAEGTLIAFATGDRNVADDNPKERNGLFTKHLLAAIQQPGLSIETVFKQVKEEVYRASAKNQLPYIYDGIIGQFSLIEPPSARPVLQPSVQQGQAPLPSDEIERLRAQGLHYSASIRGGLGPVASSVLKGELRPIAEKIAQDSRYASQAPCEAGLVYRAYATTLLFSQSSNPIVPIRDSLVWLIRAIDVCDHFGDDKQLHEAKMFFASIASGTVAEVNLRTQLTHMFRVALPGASEDDVRKRADEMIAMITPLLKPNTSQPGASRRSSPADDMKYLQEYRISRFTVGAIMETARLDFLARFPNVDVGGLPIFVPLSNGNTKVMWSFSNGKERLTFEWEVNKDTKVIKPISQAAIELMEPKSAR